MFTMNRAYPFLRSFSTSCVHRTKCWPRPDYGPMEVQRSKLMNGIRVACASPMGAPIAACTIMFQAGSRFECDDQIGVTHFLRACSAASGSGYTAYSKTRVLQQFGAYITCSSDRQSIAYTLRCPVSVFCTVKYYLLDIAARCSYNQWEIDDRKPMIKTDLQRIHPEQLCMDLVQKACWGGPLNNSIFCEEERIDGMSESSLNAFTKENFTTDECTVSSVGLPFEEVIMLAEKIEYKREPPPPRRVPPSIARHGFEFYDYGPNSDTWIAFAVPGCGTTDLPCLMTHSLIAASCGTGNVQMGQHSQDRTPQGPLGLMARDIFTDLKAFNVSYYDTGIFGILVRTRSATACEAAVIASNFLQSLGSLDCCHIQVGKQRLKTELAIHDDDCVRVSEGLALQSASNQQIDSASTSMCMVDLITPDEAICVAKTLACKRDLMAMAVVGDVQAVPHDRELLKA
ncbi:cytochrome b-c1 complex subunit 2, mitochondrial-like [Choristoneura fumiferana]|uniref:cytochrome b-c1 complex subunit 2, mitochondrial-like n=1 Tax=Choristoneura fumiferana TaxID=7141 RepID=UPI003D159621